MCHDCWREYWQYVAAAVPAARQPVSKWIPSRIWIGHITNTEWQRPIGCLKLQNSFHQRATHYRALLRKETYNDKASYGSYPPCMSLHTRECLVSYAAQAPIYIYMHTYVYICTYVCTCIYIYMYAYICVRKIFGGGSELSFFCRMQCALAYLHMRQHARAHVGTPAHIHTSPHTQTHTEIHASTHSYTLSLSLTHIHTHTNTYTHTRTQTHTNARTHT